jgi:two-component system phosphate regulon sensor histidine kinase PhoR
MEVLMHPVVRYWFAGACVLAIAALVAIHTTHLALAAAIAGVGVGLIAGTTRALPAVSTATTGNSEPPGFLTGLPGIVSALEPPAVVFDAGQAVVAFNGPGADLFPGIELGVPMSRISRHPDLLGALSMIAGDGVPRAIEMVDHAPNGRRLRASLARLSPASNGKQQPVVLVQFRDLSEQDRLDQMRSDFIANASHELRTPLASLRGFIETLQGPASKDEEARAKFLDIMGAQSARMMRILDDLLSLSRIEMRAHLPPPGQVEAGGLIREVVQGLEPLAQSSRVGLHLSPPNEPLMVRGDRDELIQVFQNLIQNAIKYGNEDGRVDIALSRDPASPAKRPRLRVSVTDDGPGIAAEHLPRLTERFYRVDTAMSRARGGTGLGLAIVKHILNRHRGDLRITSTVGKGSTFTVLLDLVK